MKSFIKAVLYIVSGLAVLAIIFAVIGNSGVEAEKKKEASLYDQHCQMKWEELSNDKKRKVLNEFISANGFDSNIGMAAAAGIKAAVKYPETVTIDDETITDWVYLSQREASIVDIEKGIIRYQKNFLAKNKLNMDVRSKMIFDLQYNAGCQKIKPIDFKVE